MGKALWLDYQDALTLILLKGQIFPAQKPQGLRSLFLR